MDTQTIQQTLENAIKEARQINEGYVVSYIPELANVDPDLLSVCIHLNDGRSFLSGDYSRHIFTLQSVSKLIVLIGLLEESEDKIILSKINVEPSGQSFTSLARLDDVASIPSNPMVNAGALTLCAYLHQTLDSPFHWIEDWIVKLFGELLPIDHAIYLSEYETGDRNRAIAYLLKSTGLIKTDVEKVLETYFSLCSISANIEQVAFLPMLLANEGVNSKNERVISKKTAHSVLSLMATCGLYDDSGYHLWQNGLPAKSGVSGLIAASAIGYGGVAVCGPKINDKGTSLRGQYVLNRLSEKFGWHFASKTSK